MTQVDTKENEKFQPTDPETFMRKTEEVANQAVEDAAEVLAILPAEERQKEEARLRQEAIENYKTARINGRANDMYSFEPGIKIYVNEHGFLDITSKCRSNGFPLTEDELRQIDETTWEVTLPNGTFTICISGIQFYKDNQAHKEGPKSIVRKTKPTNAFGLHGNRVKRVECANGRLWQNPQYNWDLSHKITG